MTQLLGLVTIYEVSTLAFAKIWKKITSYIYTGIFILILIQQNSLYMALNKNLDVCQSSIW